MQPTTCEIVEEAKKCANIPYELMNELHSLASPWPYLWWGIDIRTFSKGPPGQVKYLVAVVDYFTKWVKVETLMIITTKTMALSSMIGNFVNCSGLNIMQRFTSVKHPQTNDQAKATNWIILRGLMSRVKEAKGTWVEQPPHVLWAY